MKILHVPIVKKWFDMILSGEKTAEYREIKPHWMSRLIRLKEDMEAAVWYEFVNDLNNPDLRHNGAEDCLKYFNAELEKFDAVKLVNGYGNHRPSFIIELKNLTVGQGKPEWGAILGKYYFVLELGEIIK